MAVFPRTYVAADNAGSRTIVIVALISPVLATVTVAARFYARKLQRLGFAVDDWLILSALVRRELPSLHYRLLNPDPATSLGSHCHHLVM